METDPDSRPRGFLVLGGSGMLGQALVRELVSRRLAFDAPGRDQLDLEPSRLTRARLIRDVPAAVINAAGFTDVAGAEDHVDEAFRLNRDLPRVLAEFCREFRIPLVHVSTDYVFDGKKTVPYVEDDPVAPLQVYGQSKLAGEQEVLEIHERSLVVRTSTLYGPGCRRRLHYVDAVLSRARNEGRLELVRPPVSSPTYAPDLAEAICELVEVGATGIVHWANAGSCSRFELATEALEISGLAGGVAVQERPEPSGGLARPAYSVMDTSRYTALTGRTARAWQDALCEYIEERR